MAENSINLLRHHLAHRNVEKADIIINPRVGNAHWGKFLDGKDIISAGEKATKIKLLQLKESIHRENKDILSKFLDFLKL